MDLDRCAEERVAITPGKILTLKEIDQLVEALKEWQQVWNKENAELLSIQKSSS